MKRNIIILSLFSTVCFFVCTSCFSGSESEKIKKLKIEAEKGDAMAQYLLGGAYYFGDEISVDNDKAFEWLEKSAEQNNSEAQYYLGIMNKNGDGILPNMVQSFFWFKKSAEQGNAYAQYELATIYDAGIGTFKDRRNAIYWYEKSVEQGNKEAEEYLKFMINFVGEEQLPNDQKSIENCKLLAKKGNDMAQFYLGLLYLNGNGVEKDIKKTKYWISESLSRGNSKAQEIWDEYELWMYKDVID
jgi:hypothetical protein